LKLKASKVNEDNVTDVAVEIGKFLQDWLTKHVIESDLPLKAYLKRNAEEAKETDDLAEQSQPAPH
jgi:hemerythrin